MKPYFATVRRDNPIIAIICGILFVSFSFVYLYLFQGEVMRLVFDTCFQGRFSYSPFWGAVILTLALCIIRWLFNKVTRFRGSWLAFSYLPAYCILSFLTCVHPTEGVVDGKAFSMGFSGIWIAVVAYVAIGCWYRKFLYRRSYGVRNKLTETLLPNLIVVIMGSYATGFVGNDNVLLHHELAVAQYIRVGEFEKALGVGQKSLHNSHTLTALRAFALSNIDSLGQRLFCYPQGYGADGLFLNEGQGDASSVSDENLQVYLGCELRHTDEPAVEYLQRLYSEDSCASAKVIDYYLCALLLEKRLEEFYNVLLSSYADQSSPLPRHYQEALLAYGQLTGNEPAMFAKCGEDIKARHRAFIDLQKEYQEPLHQSNYTRRRFGDTYWWYYCYGE